MKYSSMKKNDLVLELEKRDNEIKRTREIMKMAAQEINGLELSNASARMFIGALVKDIMDLQEVEEVFVDKQIMSELFESHYVDFKNSDEQSVGAILKLVAHAKPDADNVDMKQEGRVPEYCYHNYGDDLDGCSTQANEGCGRCSLYLGQESEGEEIGEDKLTH